MISGSRLCQQPVPILYNKPREILNLKCFPSLDCGEVWIHDYSYPHFILFIQIKVQVGCSGFKESPYLFLWVFTPRHKYRMEKTRKHPRDHLKLCEQYANVESYLHGMWLIPKDLYFQRNGGKKEFA